MTAWRAGIVVSTALVASSLVAAQTAKVMSAPDEPGANASAIEPDRGRPFEGRVLAYLLSPDARVAGLLFEEGRQVNLPPDAGRRVSDIIRPGMQVRVDARPADPEGGPGAAWPVLTVVESGRRVAPDKPGAAPPPRPAADQTTLSAMRVGGTVDRPMRGPRGEINGVRLTDGVQVFFPPHVALENSPSLAKGMRLEVEGFGRQSEFGTAVQATVVTTGSGQTIRVYPRP